MRQRHGNAEAVPQKGRRRNTSRFDTDTMTILKGDFRNPFQCVLGGQRRTP